MALNSTKEGEMTKKKIRERDICACGKVKLKQSGVCQACNTAKQKKQFKIGPSRVPMSPVIPSGD